MVFSTLSILEFQNFAVEMSLGMEITHNRGTREKEPGSLRTMGSMAAISALVICGFLSEEHVVKSTESGARLRRSNPGSITHYYVTLGK